LGLEEEFFPQVKGNPNFKIPLKKASNASKDFFNQITDGISLYSGKRNWIVISLLKLIIIAKVIAESLNKPHSSISAD